MDLPKLTPQAVSSWHLYPICVRKKAPFRDKLLLKLHNSGIMANVHYTPLPKLKFYNSPQNKYSKRIINRCKQAVEYSHKTISLPIYPNLKKEHQNQVSNLIKNYIQNN